MTAVLYWMSISHPSVAARKMLDLKHVPYELVHVRPLNQRLHLRLAGFRSGTVPALKLDGRRVHGTRAISRALDECWPEPPLFPSEPALRARVQEAERWGDEEFQPVPRRLFRYGVATNRDLRRAIVRGQRVPAPDLVAAAMRSLVGYYAKTIEADGRCATDAGIRADLAALPEMLARVDRLLDDGTLTLDPPNAATLQILATVRLLDAFEDLQGLLRPRACVAPARELFAEYRVRVPSFLDPAWLEPIGAEGL